MLTRKRRKGVRFQACPQVEVLTRETRRLTTENNYLHTQLIAAADKLERFERTTQQVHRRLEQRVSDAASQHRAAAQRRDALQQENAELLHRLGLEDTASGATGWRCACSSTAALTRSKSHCAFHS